MIGGNLPEVVEDLSFLVDSSPVKRTVDLFNLVDRLGVGVVCAIHNRFRGEGVSSCRVKRMKREIVEDRGIWSVTERVTCWKSDLGGLLEVCGVLPAYRTTKKLIK